MKAKTKTKHVPTFADSLTRNMADTGLMDEDLAILIGYRADTIYRWRTGKMIPSMRARNACLQALTSKRRKA